MFSFMTLHSLHFLGLTASVCTFPSFIHVDITIEVIHNLLAVKILLKLIWSFLFCMFHILQSLKYSIYLTVGCCDTYITSLFCSRKFYSCNFPPQCAAHLSYKSSESKFYNHLNQCIMWLRYFWFCCWMTSL